MNTDGPAFLVVSKPGSSNAYFLRVGVRFPVALGLAVEVFFLGDRVEDVFRAVVVFFFLVVVDFLVVDPFFFGDRFVAVRVVFFFVDAFFLGERVAVFLVAVVFRFVVVLFLVAISVAPNWGDPLLTLLLGRPTRKSQLSSPS